MSNNHQKKGALIDKGILSVIITVCLAVLAGGIAWGKNANKIDHNSEKVSKLESILGHRMNRMEYRTRERFNSLDKKLETILKAIRRR